MSWVARIGVFSLFLLISSRVSAQTLTTLFSFNGTNGQAPFADLTLSADGSTLYGMTPEGGANGYGTIFSIPVSGGNPTTLSSFAGGNGSLTLSGSTLYGMTSYGGGTIFSIPVTGGTRRTLFSFDGTHGLVANGSLTLSGSTLYGMTVEGGVSNCGTVFSIPVSGGTPTILAILDVTSGIEPMGSVTLSGSTLYGMTRYGGGTYGSGTVFSVPVSGGTPTVLINFNGTNGANPYGNNLTLSGSTFYGMTELGGADDSGTIFSIPVGGGSPTTLFSFNRDDAAYPTGSLTCSGSTLYGMTSNGGPNDDGTVFSIPVSGGTPKTLLTFNGTNGANPAGSLTIKGSTLYGMTQQGGANGDGTVFALDITPASVGLTNVANVTIISGGTATLGTTVSNSPSSGYNLNYTLTAAVQSGSATLGAITSGTGSLAPSVSQSCTVSASSTNLGNNVVSFTASDPDASNSPQTTTATLTVLGHANPALGSPSNNNQTIITGGTLASVTLNLTNLGTNLSPLDVNTLSNLSGSSGTAVVPSGGTASYTATGFNTTTVGLNKTLPVSLYAGDEQSLSGGTALTQQPQTVTYTVLGHSNPVLGSASNNNQTIITGGTLASVTLNLTNLGTNLSPLDVNTLSNLSGSSGTAVVPSGGTASYTATGFNTTTVGLNKTLPVSLYAGDEQALSGGTALTQQNQSVTYTVYGHSQPALSLVSGGNQTIIFGGTVSAVFLGLSNTAGNTPSPLDVSTLSANLSGGTGTAVVGSGGTGLYMGTLNTGTIGLGQTQSFSLMAGDEQLLSGHGSLGVFGQNAVLNVYGHSQPTLSLVSGGSQTIITGGTVAAVAFSLNNTAGNTPSPLDVSTLSANLIGATGTAVVASGGTGSYLGTLNTGSIGLGQTQSFSVMAGDEQLLSGHGTLGVLSQNAVLNVYGHAAPTIAISQPANVIVRATGIVANLNLSNGSANQSGLASLDVDSLGTGVSGGTGGALIASGLSKSYTAALSTSTFGPQTQIFSLNVGDDHTLPGAAAATNLSTTAALTVYDHSNASLSPTGSQTTQTVNFGNVLKGATASENFTIYNLAANTSAQYTANMKMTGFTTSGGTAFHTNLATFSGLSAASGSNGNAYTASLNTSSNTTGSQTISIAANQLVDDSTLPGAGNNNSGGLTITLQANVGNAAADNSNSPTAFGPAMTAQVAQNASYANLASTVTSTTGSGGQGMVGSTATILDGTASGAATVSMAWRTAVAQPSGGGASEGFVSDVVDLSGMTIVDGQTHDGSVHTDTFALEMSYDPAAVTARTGLSELAAAEAGDIVMDYLDLGSSGVAGSTGSQWELAVAGNFGSTNEHFVGVGAWDGDMTLGDYGVDVDTHTVWAVVNHNSEFAVVPEPSALVLLAAGAVGLVALRLRRQRKGRLASPLGVSEKDESPAILSFPSQRLRQSEGRRRAA